MPKKTTEQFVKEAKTLNGDKYDYSKVEYKGARKRVTIICNAHKYEFTQTPACHLNGRGCPKCIGRNKTTQEFIKEAKLIKDNNNKYNYDEVNYIDSTKKIKIWCNEHKYYFYQSPSDHLSGKGCPKCSKTSKILPNEFIQKMVDIYDNKFDYSKTNYINMKTKVEIWCNDCKEYFWQKPYELIYNKRGHKKCNKKQPFFSKETFEIAARKIHKDKYNYDEVNYINSKTKVKIFCKYHNYYFYQLPLEHLSKCGCPKCNTAGRKIRTTDDFIREAKLLKNNINLYNYDNVLYTNSKSKVKILCLTHNGFFNQSPSKHLQGQGCPICFGKAKLTTEIFIKRAKLLKDNNIKYLYDKVIYINYNTKVLIFCISCNYLFSQTPDDHLNGAGCPKCIGRNKTKEEFVAEAKLINNNAEIYDYSDVVYIDSRTKIKIFCKKHNGYFEQSPHDHLSGKSRCNICVNRSSIQENEWLNSLNIPELKKQWHIPKTRYSADGYDPKTNTIYEYNGDYWHGNPNNEKFNFKSIHPTIHKTYEELYRNSLKKEAKIRELGYNLIIMWEKDWIDQQKSK
jgi:hypothetical protein